MMRSKFVVRAALTVGYFFWGDGVGVAVAEVFVLTDVPAPTAGNGFPVSIDFVGDAVAVARSVVTPPTDCGEIFLGVDFGGATCGGEDIPPETLSRGARRGTTLSTHALYFLSHSCLQAARSNRPFETAEPTPSQLSSHACQALEQSARAAFCWGEILSAKLNETGIIKIAIRARPIAI
jgi:hypothetical protein